MVSISKRKCFEGVNATKELLILLEVAIKEALAPEALDLPCQLGSNNGYHSVVQRAMQPMSLVEAKNVLIDYKKVNVNLTYGGESVQWIPVKVLRSIEIVLKGSNQVNALLSNRTSLAFTTVALPDSVVDDSQLSIEQIKFRQRMDRLRLKNEESKYVRLTGNLGMKPEADDVTMKSMTYAASIGLNMIIAPLAFGCFMYFFAGSLLDYFWKREVKSPNNNSTDVRKVIAGVVSGVLMLFIEMILFVIRTHEMDRVIRMKQRKTSRPKPFGHYSSKTNRNFAKSD